MARIDSLLSILKQQNADELQLGTDREPKMLAHGALKRLSLPATSEQTLRDLLGDILTAEREQVVRAKGRLQARYVSGGYGAFDVKIASRAGSGFDVTFVREIAAVETTGPAESAPAAAGAARPPSALPEDANGATHLVR